MKPIAALLICLFLFISCNEIKKEPSSEKTSIEKKEVAADYKNVEVEIEGMTCEIGCARTIQSKLSKVDGITYSKVNFETKKGQFSYDANKLSVDDIVKKINGIAGGGLYTVTKTEEISEIKTDSIS